MHLVYSRSLVPAEVLDTQACTGKLLQISLLSDTPVASKRAFGEVLETVTISEEALASLEFSTEKVGPVSIKKSTSLFPTVIFTQGSLWEISVEPVVPRGDPGPCHSWSLSIIWGISGRGCEQIISISAVSLAL